MGTLYMFNPSSIFNDRSKVVLLLWIHFSLFMCHECLCYAVLFVCCSLVIICLERTDLLALLCVVFSCFVSLSQMVSRVSCDT